MKVKKVADHRFFLVTKRNSEFLHAIGIVVLHDMPNDRLSADLDQWLGPLRSLLGKSGSEPASQNSNRWVISRDFARLLKGIARQHTGILELRHWERSVACRDGMAAIVSYQKEKKRKEIITRRTQRERDCINEVANNHCKGEVITKCRSQ